MGGKVMRKNLVSKMLLSFILIGAISCFSVIKMAIDDPDPIGKGIEINIIKNV